MKDKSISLAKVTAGGILAGPRIVDESWANNLLATVVKICP